MPGQRDILTAAEANAFADFVAFAAENWAGGQAQLAEMVGVSPGMISLVRSRQKKAGGRTVRGVATATGIPVEEILSGVGIAKLKARLESGTDRKHAEVRLKAAQALAIVLDVSPGDAMAVLDELGVSIPSTAPASTWFDVGRAAIERKRAGIPLSR